MTLSKPRLLLLALLTGLAALAIAIFMMTRDTAPVKTADRAALEQSALFKITGLPKDISIEGEVRIAGALHPLSLLAEIPGQRVYGIKNLADTTQKDYAVSLRLNDKRDGTMRDIGWQIGAGDNNQYSIRASAAGFTAQTTATLSLNGRVAIPATPFDWNGRITLSQTADKTDLVQFAILPDIYETYAIVAGNLLPYYLEDFFHPAETRHGLPQFGFGDDTASADSNKLAEDLLEPGNGRAIGWWANDDKTALVTRHVSNECDAKCPTAIYLRDGDTWRPVFSGTINALWIDAATIGKEGSVFYTDTFEESEARWIWQDDRYVQDSNGGAP